MIYSIGKYLSLFTLVIISLSSCKKDPDFQGDYTLTNPGSHVDHTDRQGPEVGGNYVIGSVPTNLPLPGNTYIDMGSWHLGSDLVWKVSQRTRRFVNSAGGTPSNNQTYCQMAWDNSKLYVAFECRDKDLLSQDSLVIMIDYNNDGDDILIVKITPTNTVVQEHYIGGALLPSSTIIINSVSSTYSTVDNSVDDDDAWTGKVAINFQNATNAPFPSFLNTWKINFKRVNYNNSALPTYIDNTYWKYPLSGDYFSSAYPNVTFSGSLMAPVIMKGLILNTVPMELTSLGFEVKETSPDGLSTKDYIIELPTPHSRPGVFEYVRSYQLATSLIITPFVIDANGNKRKATSQTMQPIR